MKKLKIWQKAGLASLLTITLIAGPIPGLTDVNEKDLAQIIIYGLVKGEQHPAEPMRYMEVRSKTEKGMRKVYFEVFYSGSENEISANKIRFVETEYILTKVDKDTPHESLITENFSPYIGKAMVIINQKMIVDGGEYGTLDGKADVMMERTLTKTVDEDIVLTIGQTIEIKDKEKIKQSYHSYIKEILNITGGEELKPETPKPLPPIYVKRGVKQ